MYIYICGMNNKRLIIKSLAVLLLTGFLLYKFLYFGIKTHNGSYLLKGAFLARSVWVIKNDKLTVHNRYLTETEVKTYKCIQEEGRITVPEFDATFNVDASGSFVIRKKYSSLFDFNGEMKMVKCSEGRLTQTTIDDLLWK